MGFLSPLFLLAGVAIGIPLLLHLFHRQELRRLAFPALRYLQRTEKEHATRIRLRQLLLLLLRVGAIMLLVAAGARPFLKGPGTAHPPTAVAIILDNSMSSGRLIGDRLVLDDLKQMALTTLDRAGDRDRIWVMRAGEPWNVTAPQSPEDARRRVQGTEVSAARGDLDGALERAASLLASADLLVREIHLLSDLQRTAFAREDPEPVSGIPVVVYAPNDLGVTNRSVSRVTVGGGLPPIQGQRSQVAAHIAGDSTSTDSVSVRLVVNGEIRGAALVPPNTDVLFPVEIAGAGAVTGYVEADPDGLNLDDRRFFAFNVRPPPVVHVANDVGVFVDEAVRVLSDGHRIALDGRTAPIVVSGGSADVDATATARVVFPPEDPVLLPGVNRRLADQGVPWRFVEVSGEGELSVRESTLPHGLEELRVLRRYELERVTGTNQAGSNLVTLSNGSPWLVSVETGGRRHLLFGSPMVPEWSTLPVSSVLVPLLEWTLGRWAAAEDLDPEIIAGDELPLPVGATGLGDPLGTLVPLDGTPARPVKTGVYTAIGADGPLGRWVVNPPPEESNLTPVSTGELELRAAQLKTASDPSAWTNAVFDQRQGPEVWRSLLIALLVVLILESLVASSGRREEHQGMAGARTA